MIGYRKNHRIHANDTYDRYEKTVGTPFTRQEIVAITEAAKWLLERSTGQRTVSFCSDSRAALMALDSISLSLKEVLRCRQALESLAEHNMVRLVWVPVHSGVVGNEKADKLAGRGANGIPARRCAVAVSTCEVNRAIKDWLNAQLSDKCTNAKGLRQARALMGNSPPVEWLRTIGG
ncbi:uncharacterized protein LOC103317528 [Nasonia vitripennis]|uniref:RNase H type-1 domain-containing protein n=1 Tax=Nasonia vitripennis TaxID=7425 RepID=A0A7M7HBS2_NASVI|nr:uncharacterized protein LOC103317528 [Nasonia vitripennis]